MRESLITQALDSIGYVGDGASQVCVEVIQTRMVVIKVYLMPFHDRHFIIRNCDQCRASAS
jgi:hypothetical protein